MTTIPFRTYWRHFLKLGILIFGTAYGVSIPSHAQIPADFVSVGPRSVLDLTGTWEAREADLALTFPAPDAGWKPHAVPHESTSLVDQDGVGPYFLHSLDQILEADGKTFKRKDKLAAWFRRSFDMGNGLPAAHRLLLHCDGIAWRSQVWLNGKQVGASLLGLAPATYDVTEAVRAGKNEILIGLTGRAGLWDAEKKTFIAPFSGTVAGIWDTVRLELVPELRLEDVFVRTEVSKKRIQIDVTLVNDGVNTRTAVPDASIIGPMGVPQRSVNGEVVEIPAKGKKRVTLSADWMPVWLWGPGSPNLHQCAMALYDEKKTLLDRTETAFGCREFTAKGRDFLLNGTRQVLLRTSWLTICGWPREKVLQHMMEQPHQFNCVRQHLAMINPHVIQQADSMGLMVIPEFWGFYANNDKPFPITQRETWLPNIEETMRRVVKRYRNHPSVIMWSLTNETMWNSTTPEHMEVADRIISAVRSVDSTRLLQGDAEISYAGRLPTISIHYPEFSAATGVDLKGEKPDTVGRLYPNSGWLIPNDFSWLKKDGISRAWRSEFEWDRPLMLGEYYCPDNFAPERYTPYGGDEIYDVTKWAWQNFDGRDSQMPKGSPWISMAKMSTDHYRAAGVACLNPWTGVGVQIVPKLLVAPLDYHPNAWAGEEAPRRFFVANDGSARWNAMHLQAGLFINGREIWSERKIPAQVEPGASKEIMLAIRPPALAAATQARLIVRLCYMRGPHPTELHRHEEDMWILPKSTLTGVGAKQVALVDFPQGKTMQALRAMGLMLLPGKGDDAALAGKHLLIIGEDAAGQADLASAARFAERGGRLLVLHQKEMERFLPGQPQIDSKHAASISWKSAPHPALAGLADEQLRFWRPDHLVAMETLVRPSAGAAAPQTTCGGSSGMHWSPLVEIQHGKGGATFCQYLLAERANMEPAAALILKQAITSALATQPRKVSPALYLAGEVPSATRVALKLAGVKTTFKQDGFSPALLDASAPPAADVLKQLGKQVENGRVLWLRGLNEKTAPAVASLLPWVPQFSPLGDDVMGAVRRLSHPFTAGLGSGDFHWATGIFSDAKKTASLGGPVLVPPQASNAILLLEPALLVAVPVGRGWILVDQLAWDQALSVQTERAMRITSCLARNIGAGFEPSQITLLPQGQGAQGLRLIAAWDGNAFDGTRIPAQVGDQPLTGKGTLVNEGKIRGVRLEKGQTLTIPKMVGPIAEGGPFALEMAVAPDGLPGGYFGGLMECGSFGKSGLRMMLTRDQFVVIEHFAAKKPGEITYIKSREPVPVGRFTTIRYEHDGERGALFIDGTVQDVKTCPPPPVYRDGMRIGQASGKDYFLNGVIGNIRIFALPTAPLSQ